MYFIIPEQCILSRKGEGGSGMRDRPCKASILGFRCNEQPPPSLMTEPLVFIVCNGRMVHCSICYCSYIIP